MKRWVEGNDPDFDILDFGTLSLLYSTTIRLYELIPPTR